VSEQEKFVTRWSRLKRTSAQTGKMPADAASSEVKQEAAVDRPAGASRCDEGTGEPFDVSQLPSIESLTASSDIKAFLQPGVPAQLTKAALRKVWTTVPAIRDFIGIAENQWDFTDPTAIPGFGPLKAGDDVSQLVAQAMGKVRPQADAGAIAEATDRPLTASAERAQPPAVPAKSASTAQDTRPEERPTGEVSAVQHGDPSAKDQPVTNRRSHGRALPR
jgi:hypothetical protein